MTGGPYPCDGVRSLTLAAHRTAKFFRSGCPERRMPFVVLMTARKSTGERTARHEPELRIPALPGRADPDPPRDPVPQPPPRPTPRPLRPSRRTEHPPPGP